MVKRSASRRTTLTLPAQCLDMAQEIASERHLNLSSVVGEALQRGLQEEQQRRRNAAILQAYQRAFTGFSADELLLLDGIVTEHAPPPKPSSRRRQTGGMRRRARR
jgi:hypothetical protein